MKKKTKNTGRKTNPDKTKAQLQKALEESGELLREEEKKLAKCQKQLEKELEKTKQLAQSAVEEKDELLRKVTILEEQISNFKDIGEATAVDEPPQPFLLPVEEVTPLPEEEVSTMADSVMQRETAIDEEEAIPPINDEVSTMADSGIQNEAAIEKEEVIPSLEEEVSAKADSVIRIAPSINEVLRTVQFRQYRNLFEPGSPVRARQPFTVITRLQFPVIPCSSNTDVDSSSFDIFVTATDQQEQTVLLRTGIADMLIEGVAEYKNEIPVSGLEAGEYFLRIKTLALYAGVEESKKIKLLVE